MNFLLYTLAIIGAGLVVSASMITLYYLIDLLITAYKERNENK